MKNFKVILGVFLGLAAMGAIALVIGSQANPEAEIYVLCPQKDENEVLATVKEIACQGSCVADTLQEELAQEHDRHLEEVQDAYPLTQKKWDRTFSQIQSAKDHDNLLIDKPAVKHQKGDLLIVKRTREIMAEHSIDPAVVTIKIRNNPNIKTNAASYQGYLDNKVIHELELNIPQLCQHPQDVQEAIIRHELMHLINYDPLERAYIEVMLMKNGITEQEFMQEPAMLDWYKHQEFRADLLAACHGIETAQSFQKDFEHYIATRPEDQFEEVCTTHPSDLKRLEAVTQLVTYLEAENKIKLA